MNTSIKIYLFAFLSTFTLNLRNANHRLSLMKHAVLGIVVGMILGIVISVTHANFFLSLLGNNTYCPIITNARNIIGCTAGFVYQSELGGSLLGALIGFLVFLVRKTTEEVKRLKQVK